MYLTILFAIGLFHFVSSSSNNNVTVCENLKSTERLTSQDYCEQPLYLTLIETSEKTKNLDHVCYKMIPLAVKGYYFVYEVSTYQDDRYEVDTYIIVQGSPGKFTLISPSEITLQVKLGWACDTMVEYTCSKTANISNSAIGITTKYGQLSPSCIQQAQEILAAQKLPATDWFPLPMKLKPKCLDPKFISVVTKPSFCEGAPNPQLSQDKVEDLSITELIYGESLININ